tara:strand:+ start:2468 stop:2722 length:255 start_codon:yes stop_codon:yes gene_type:complete
MHTYITIRTEINRLRDDYELQGIANTLHRQLDLTYDHSSIVIMDIVFSDDVLDDQETVRKNSQLWNDIRDVQGQIIQLAKDFIY